MDTDIISFETLIATQDSARWVMLGAIATGIAAFGSLITAGYAIVALNTWKNQEKTKIRSEFKRSLLALDYSIHMVPDGWNQNIAQVVQIMAMQSQTSSSENKHFVAINEVKKCWHNAISAWVMCEGILKKTKLTKKWHELSVLYLEYIQGKVDKLSVLEKLAEMHSIEFIFD